MTSPLNANIASIIRYREIKTLSYAPTLKAAASSPGRHTGGLCSEGRKRGGDIDQQQAKAGNEIF